jgi:beta-lactamase regulating signal transducer with metallopeptidase domain
MNAWTEFLGLWLADFYLAATILLSIAAILFTVIRQPAPRMAVGWGSLLGLLIAAALCVSPSRPRFDLRQFFIRPATPVAETEPEPVPIASPSVVATAAPRPDEAEELAFDRFEPPQLPVEQSARTDAPTTEPVSSEPPAVAWGPRIAALAVGLFLAGLVAMAGWLIVGVLQASRLVRRSAPAPVGCCDELRKIAGAAARLPRLRMNRRLVMPVATGTLRPAILLPEGFAETGSRNALKAVLAHEWTHIKNGDLWLLAVDRLLLSLLWAHPLYWWTRRRIRTNQEFLADAAAASQIGPTDYAALLVEWARNLAAHRGLTALTAVGIWERPAALEQRVAEILKHDHAAERCSGRVRAVLLVCLAGLGLIATSLSLRPPVAESAPLAEPPVATRIVQTSPHPPLETPASGQVEHVLPGANEIRVTCLDADKRPIADALVSLYRIDFDRDRQVKLEQGTTNRDGQYVFAKATPMKSPIWMPRPYLVIARREGCASNAQRAKPGESIQLPMAKPASLTGTVTDTQGKPIADALVSCGTIWPGDDPIVPIEGFRCVRTDMKGDFTIRDLPEYQYKPRRIATKTKLMSAEITLGPPALRIEHPRYVGQFINYTKIPDALRAVLQKGTTITGRVIDDRTSQPVAGVRIFLQEVTDQNLPRRWLGSSSVETDADGRYRFAPVPAGKFNLMLGSGPPDLTAAAIVSFEAPGEGTVEAPPLHLIPGTIVRGRVIDDVTGQPVRRDDDEYLDIQIHGASRPANSAAVEVAQISNNGTFEIRLPSGTHWFGLRTDHTGETFLPVSGGGWHNVPQGGELQLEFHVRRVKPPKSLTGQVSPKDNPLSAAAEASKIVDYHVGKDEIGGLCLGRGESRIPEVQVSLYIDRVERPQGQGLELLGQTITNADGQFLFRHVPPLRSHRERFLVIARRQGRETSLGHLDHRHDWLDLSVPVANPLKGSLKDEYGHPIAGALVRCDQAAFYSLGESIQSARTDARGNFEIDDVAGVGRCLIEHAGYARRTLFRLKRSELANVKLVKEGVVEGLVIDRETGQPAGGVPLAMQPIDPPRQQWDKPFVPNDASLFFAEATTDRNGRYRFGTIPAGTFNIFARQVPGRASIAIDSLEVTAGHTVQAPPLRLVRGGVVKGRLIDAGTGKPALVGDDEEVTIGTHGPARPRSGAVIEGFSVGTDGTFELRLPPGKNTAYLAGGPFFVVDPAHPNTNQYKQVIEIKEGQESTIEFRVIRMTPMKIPTSKAQSRPQATPIKRSQNDASAPTMLAGASATNLVSEAGPSAGVEDKSSAHAAAGRFSGTVRVEAVANELAGRTSVPDESLKVNRTVANGIANVFVYLAESPDGRPFAAPPQAFCLRTDGKAFSPRAGIVRVGQALTLRNDGRRPANFHFFPNRNNPTINHAIRPGSQATPQVRMAVPERTPFEVRSDVHSWMRATVLVLDHPFAAVTDELGAFEIADLPPGKYAFRVWHERAGFLERALTIEIKPGETTKAKLSYKLDRFEH